MTSDVKCSYKDSPEWFWLVDISSILQNWVNFKWICQPARRSFLAIRRVNNYHLREGGSNAMVVHGNTKALLIWLGRKGP